MIRLAEYLVIEQYKDCAPEPFGYQRFAVDPAIGQIIMLRWSNSKPAYAAEVQMVNNTDRRIRVESVQLTLPGILPKVLDSIDYVQRCRCCAKHPLQKVLLTRRHFELIQNDASVMHNLLATIETIFGVPFATCNDVRALLLETLDLQSQNVHVAHVLSDSERAELRRVQ